MEGRTTRRQARLNPFTHVDVLPKIPIIPFNLDDFCKRPSVETTTPVNQKRYVKKLDLPPAYNNTRPKNFTTHHKVNRKKTPRQLKTVEKKTGMTIFSDEDQIHLDSEKYQGIDNLQRRMKKKLSLYLSRKKVSFVMNGEYITFTRSVASIQQAHIRAHTGKQSQDDPETYPWRGLVNHFKWVGSMDLSIPVVANICKTWKNLAGPTLRKLEAAKSAKLLEDSVKRFMNLDFLNLESKFSILRDISCRAVVPDIFKMMALAAWKSGDRSKCIFYLSESHDHLIRREIRDKHASHFYRKTEYFRSPSQLTPQEAKKDELYRIQSKEMDSFGKTQESFESNLNRVNQDWNIIQITKLFHHKSRLGTTAIDQIETPAIFISAFVNVDGFRQSFVTFRPAPKLEAGLSKMSILQEISNIIKLNKTINEDFKGNRRKYWDIRAQHNKRLATLLDSVEGNWIYPWGFMFSGNIMDHKIAKSITDLLASLEVKTRMTFQPPAKAVLYKLIENYNLLEECLKLNLAKLVSYLFETTTPESTVKSVAAAVAKCGSEIDVRSVSRSPTILVLDQELDQIPWECMRCLKTTPVSRVPSISLIHTLSVLQNIKKKNYNEILDPAECAYVLNPDGTLKSVEERLSAYLSSPWTGIKNKIPSYDEVQGFLQDKDIYLYCGHGSGANYFPEHRIQRTACRAVPLLMGCASLRYKSYGPRSVSTSILNSLFSATCISAVGFLWEVTDLECDRVTLELLERWAPGEKSKLPTIAFFKPEKERPRERCIANSVRLARSGATQFLTHAGLVCYGLPVSTLDCGTTD